MLDYWPVAREYSIWNAVVAALNFWTADLKALILSSTTKEVYRTFFYMLSAHTLHQMSDEILFGHFMTRLNAAFEQNSALEDEGYESGLENFNIPTPLRRTSKITMFQALRMPLLIQFQLHHTVPDNLTSDLYTGG